MPVKVRFIKPVQLGGQKMRYSDDGLRKKQEAMMKKLEQDTMKAVQENTETMLTMTQAKTRVSDAGKDAAAFEADLKAFNVPGATHAEQSIRWFIPQTSVDEWIAAH